MRISLLGLTVIILALFGCKEQKPAFSDFNGFVQGTTYSIVFENSGKFDPVELKSDVEELLHGFDMSLSLYQDSSILSRINRNEEAVPDSFFIEAFKKSVDIYELTDGAFDITVGPLVQAWGFGPDEYRNFDESKLDSLMPLIGMNKVKMSGDKVIKDLPGIKLDFNAIAQGYSVDIVSGFFNSLGIKHYLIEIGGEVRVRGDKGGVPWKIGIDRPVDNNFSPGNDLQAIISLVGRSLATSGNYRKFYIEDGIKYSHTIDPKTGYPAKNKLLSATIIADDCATADGIATACMVMGVEKAVGFISSHKEYDAYFIFSGEEGNFMTWMTDGLKESISEEGEN